MKINKRIAISFITIAGVLTAVVGITLAQFSDTATLTGNTLSTATPNLKISGDCSTYSTSAPGITSDSLYPGESRTKHFCLRNDSDGDLGMGITASAHITSGSLDPDLVAVTIDCGLGQVPVALNDTTSDLITTIDPGGAVASCTISQTFSKTATNSASNRTLHYTVTFTGTQVELGP